MVQGPWGGPSDSDRFSLPVNLAISSFIANVAFYMISALCEGVSCGWIHACVLPCDGSLFIQ